MGSTSWYECENQVFHLAVEDGYEPSHDACLWCRARLKWNDMADGYNQWHDLGMDEKQELADKELENSPSTAM